MRKLRNGQKWPEGLLKHECEILIETEYDPRIDNDIDDIFMVGRTTCRFPGLIVYNKAQRIFFLLTNSCRFDGLETDLTEKYNYTYSWKLLEREVNFDRYDNRECRILYKNTPNTLIKYL